MITEEMKQYRNEIKYTLGGLDILFENGDVESIQPGMVTHLYFEKDYDNLYFPIFNISVAMMDDLYERINNENETVNFRVKILKNLYDNKGKFLKYEQYCNKTFRCFTDKEKVIKDNSNREDKIKTERMESSNLRSTPRIFYLFTDDVIKCKKIFNLSIESATMTDLLVYLIGNAGITNLLMSKLTNQSILTDLMLPSGNLIESIDYLDDTMGLYDKGTLLYFDINNAYLIDKSTKCTSWRKNEVRVTHIHVANQKSGNSQLVGQYISKDRKQTHIFTHTNNVTINNKNVLHDQMSGNRIQIIDAKNNTKSDVSVQSSQIGEPNTKIITAKGSNPYTAEIMKTRLQENECILNVYFVGIDFDSLSPNKEIVLSYEDPEFNKIYGGNYRVSSSVITMKKDGEELKNECYAVLKRQD